jgi:SNF2 family DNA or RNA helicase
MAKILADKKAILLRLKNPDLVKTVIPQAKDVMHKGKQYVAVPHQIEVVQVLKNLGIDVPSPINYYYKYPGRFKPYAHQKQIAEFLTLHNRAFNLGDLGVGKTVSTLWAYDYLRSRGVVNKVLVVSPLSTLERTWADEIFNHFVHLNVAVLYGSGKKRLALLDDPTIDVYLINHDGIKISGFVEAMANRPDIDLVIVDEVAQVARNAGTDRFESLNTIVNKQCPRKAWGLTGAPIPNAPTDAWAQCRLLVPEKVPKYFNRFKDQVMRQVTQFVWVPRVDALDTVQQVMQPAIRFHRDECIDLPPCMYETRQAEMTTEQKKAYAAMMNKLVAEVQGGQVTALNEAVKAQKLIQIASGVAYGADGERMELDAKPRMEAVFELIEQSSSKTLVFVPFVGSIAPLRKFLEDRGVTTEAVYGDVPKAERDRIFSAFQKETNPRVLVAQPATLSHGLTLTAASTIVWYAPITSADTYVQANARITRPGQKHSQLIIHIEASELERRYFKRLQDKEDTQNVLLDLIKEQRTDSPIYV